MTSEGVFVGVLLLLLLPLSSSEMILVSLQQIGSMPCLMLNPKHGASSGSKVCRTANALEPSWKLFSSSIGSSNGGAPVELGGVQMSAINFV